VIHKNIVILTTSLCDLVRGKWVRRAEDTGMWKVLERAMGRRRGGNKGMKGMKEMQKEGEGLRYKRNHEHSCFSQLAQSKSCLIKI
jgi:hypothetical protein